MLRVSSGFQPLENNKTTRPASSWFQMFLALANLMKPLHSFLKYYLKNSFLSKLKIFFTEVHCMKYRIRWENQNCDDIGTLSAKLYLFSLYTIIIQFIIHLAFVIKPSSNTIRLLSVIYNTNVQFCEKCVNIKCDWSSYALGESSSSSQSSTYVSSVNGVVQL